MPAADGVSDECKEAPNMYVFEGRDYKKDQEVLASIIEEARRMDGQRGRNGILDLMFRLMECPKFPIVFRSSGQVRE